MGTFQVDYNVSNTVYGGVDDDLLIGGAFDDVLYGMNGNDTLDGGAGNDNMDGGEGDDTFLLYIGSRNDTVNDWYGSNKIIFSDVASTDSLTLYAASTDGSQFKLQYSVSDSVTFFGNDHMALYGYTETTSFSFSDGVTMSFAELIAAFPPVFQGTSGDDDLYGDQYNDVMKGEEGNDTNCIN